MAQGAIGGDVVAGLVVCDLYPHDDGVSLELGRGGHGDGVLQEFLVQRGCSSADATPSRRLWHRCGGCLGWSVGGYLWPKLCRCRRQWWPPCRRAQPKDAHASRPSVQHHSVAAESEFEDSQVRTLRNLQTLTQFLKVLLSIGGVVDSQVVCAHMNHVGARRVNNDVADESRRIQARSQSLPPATRIRTLEESLVEEAASVDGVGIGRTHGKGLGRVIGSPGIGGGRDGHLRLNGGRVRVDVHPEL